SVVDTGSATAVRVLPAPIPVAVALPVSVLASTAASRLRYAASASFTPGAASTGTVYFVGTSTPPPTGMLASPGTVDWSTVRVLPSGRVKATETPVIGLPPLGIGSVKSAR